MRGLRGVMLLTMLAASGCTPAEPPAGLAAGTPPAAVPPAAAAEPLPPVELRPRARWRRIPIDPRGGFAAAFAASEPVDHADGTRRVWIVLDLKPAIRLPETGGQARSVAFLADYRCTERAWSPIEGTWYRQPGARGPEFEDRPRQAGFRAVQPGTLIDVFLQAACRL